MNNHSTSGQQVNTNLSEVGDRPVENQTGYSAESLLLNRLNTEIDGLKQTLEKHIQHSTIERHRLRQRLGWITGLSAIAIVALAGALIGVSLNLRQEQIAIRENQQELLAQLEGVQSEQVTSEQLAQLEALLNSLNQTTGDLQDQAQSIVEQIPGASREQLESLQGDLEELQQNVQDQLSQEEGGALNRINSLFERVQDFLEPNSGSEEATEGSET